LAFEARGGGPGRAGPTGLKMIPQSFEAGPLPETSRANGGRCCPHSINP